MLSTCFGWTAATSGNYPIERKRRLKRLIRHPVLYADHIERRGVDLFEATCGRDLEGIVAKLAADSYEPAATTWVKIKNRAYSHAEGRADFFAVTSTAAKAVSATEVEIRKRDLQPC